MSNITRLTLALAITLALDATAEDVQNAHDAIDNFFSDNSAAATAGGDTTQAPAAAGDTNARDSKGLPWDERIHSGNRAFNADGTWRARRGVDKATAARIEKELLATVTAAPAAAAAIPAPPAANAGLPPIPGAALPGLPSLPAPVAAVDPAYGAFVDFVVANTKSDTNPAGKITPEWLGQALVACGIADGSLQSVAHRIDLIPQITAAFKQALGLPA